MPVAWHPNRWWDWCMSEDGMKKIDPMFIEELKKCVSVVYNMRVLKHFVEECVGRIQLRVLRHFGVLEHFG